MSKIALSGNASGTGTLTIASQNTNSNYTLTIPNETGTVLTNAGPYAAASTAPASSTYIDSSGNLGVGTTGYGTYYSSNKNISLGEGANIRASASGGDPYITISSNAYFTNTPDWKYVVTDFASSYEQYNGTHVWSSAASGTAGNTITFTERMRINSSGNVGIGTSSPNYKFQINSPTAGDSAYLQITQADAGTANTDGLLIGLGVGASPIAYIMQKENAALVFQTNATEVGRFTSGGYFKASNNGTYVNSTGTYHEFYQTADSPTGDFTGYNNSYTNAVILTQVQRSANAAYSFFDGYSGLSDLEFRLYGDGNGKCDGAWTGGGADYAEYFESANGQALTLGATVVLDGNKVREATDQDPASAIIGVVRPKEPSKASAMIGNAAWNKWANKYLTDDFDRYIMEDHDVVEWTDEDGKAYSYESHNIPAGITVPADAVRKTHDDKGNKFQHYKLNPAWDKDAEYVNRENRPEWNIIGLLGQVKVLKGQPVGDRWIKMRDVSATVEEWMVR